MHSVSLFKMLVLGLSAATAVMADAGPTRQDGAVIEKRQADDTTTTSSRTSPTQSPTSSTTTTPTASPTSPTRTTSSTRTTPTTTQGPTTTTSNTTPGDTSTSDTLQTITQIITTTDGNGAPTTITTQSTSTSTPGLAGSGSNQTSGMSPQTRNTVIGVVVGVGGAIVLGGLAFVAWRIWGRKKQPEERDDLMDYPPSSTGEKPDTGNSLNGRTPFQSTLESYHAPKQVNTASNF